MYQSITPTLLTGGGASFEKRAYQHKFTRNTNDNSFEDALKKAVRAKI